MKNLLIFLCFFYATSSLSGQDSKLIPCLILQKAASTKIFKDHFNICNDSLYDIIIIDTGYMLKSCNDFDLCSKKVRLQNKNEKNFQSPNNIVLYKAEVDQKVYILYFIRPYTGATVKLFLKQRKKKIKLIKYEWGAA